MNVPVHVGQAKWLLQRIETHIEFQVWSYSKRKYGCRWALVGRLKTQEMAEKLAHSYGDEGAVVIVPLTINPHDHSTS